jgi:hypothetical protein
MPTYVDSNKCGGGMSGCAINIRQSPAVGEGGFFQGGHAIGPCVDNIWLTLG